MLALKYLISNPDSGSKAAIEAGLSPAVYVPYSQNLNSPDVIAYGQNYLNGVINTVAGQLYGLPSHAIPGRNNYPGCAAGVHKIFGLRRAQRHSAILSGNAQGALDQMNILLALNGPDTYKYSVIKRWLRLPRHCAICKIHLRLFGSAPPRSVFKSRLCGRYAGSHNFHKGDVFITG